MRMPTTMVKRPARRRTSQTEMWIPGASRSIPTDPKWKEMSSKCRDASHAATYAPAA
jgi:hypothetical protein